MIESILNQNIALEEFDLHFFVDAYKSSYAEKRGDSDLTQDVVRLIKNRIPAAIIHQHKQNVGIAKNLFHAEKTLLEKSSWAIVIEEDVYLQNNALQSTLNLINKTNSFERIGIITISGETTTITSRGDGLYNAIGSRYYAINDAYFEKKKQIYPNYLNSISNYKNKYESSVLLNLARNGFLSPNANQDNVQWSLLVQNKFLYLTTRESLLEYTGH